MSRGLLPVTIWLLVCAAAAYLNPGWVWGWAIFFVAGGLVLVLLRLFTGLLGADRLLRRRQVGPLLAWTERTLRRAKPDSPMQRVASLYRAAALLLGGDPNTLDTADTLLQNIDSTALSPRFKNRYLLLHAQLQLYRSDLEGADRWLQQADLAGADSHMVAQLLHTFSLLFTIKGESADRAAKFAAKACDFFPEDPLFHAQLALIRLRAATSAPPPHTNPRHLLEQALKRFPTDALQWERAFYTRALSTPPGQPLAYHLH